MVAAAVNARSALPTLPGTAMSALRSLEISYASASMWMTRANGANSFNLPVARSSKRAPTTTNKSLSCTAMLAARVPCMPSMPR